MLEIKGQKISICKHSVERETGADVDQLTSARSRKKELETLRTFLKQEIDIASEIQELLWLFRLDTETTQFLLLILFFLTISISKRRNLVPAKK